MRSFNKIKFLVVVCLLCFSFSGCMMDDQDVPEPAALAYLSIYHGAPSVTGVDIYIDNVKANTQPFLYSSFSNYNSFFIGSRNLKFTPYNGSNNLIDTTINLVQDKVYSLFITNESNNLKPFVTEDIWTEPASGKALIRVVHLSPDAPAVDVTIGDSEERFFTNQNYRSISSFKEIDKGTVKLNLKSAGGDDVVVSLPDVSIQEKRIYTIIIKGYMNPEENSNALGLQVITNHTIVN